MTQTVVTVDASALSWRDMEEIEDIAGRPIGGELQRQNVSIRTLRAMTLWQLRKTRPGMTEEEFDAIPLERLDVKVKGKLGGDAAATPLAEPAATPANRAQRRARQPSRP